MLKDGPTTLTGDVAARAARNLAMALLLDTDGWCLTARPKWTGRGIAKDGAKDGVWAFNSSDGARIEGAFVSTRVGCRCRAHLIGPWRCWWPDGRLQAEGHWVANEADGEWRWWGATGVLERQGTYWKGHATGTWKRWFPNGRLGAVHNYAVGEPHGAWSEWDDDGCMILSGMYVKGAREGVWSGAQTFPWRMQITGGYRFGRKHGDWTFCDYRGRTKSRYDAGWLVSGRSIHIEEPVASIRRHGPRWVRFRCEYPDGTDIRGCYRDGFRAGVWLERHPDGRRKASGRFVLGQKQGVWTCWLPNGHVRARGEYQHGELVRGTPVPLEIPELEFCGLDDNVPTPTGAVGGKCSLTRLAHAAKLVGRAQVTSFIWLMRTLDLDYDDAIAVLEKLEAEQVALRSADGTLVRFALDDDGSTQWSQT